MVNVPVPPIVYVPAPLNSMRPTVSPPVRFTVRGSDELMPVKSTVVSAALGTRNVLVPTPGWLFHLLLSDQSPLPSLFHTATPLFTACTLSMNTERAESLDLLMNNSQLESVSLSGAEPKTV